MLRGPQFETTEKRDLYELLCQQLYKHEGNSAAAAKELGMNSNTFRRKCKSVNIDPVATKEFLKNNPQFAEVAKFYGENPPSTKSGEEVAVRETELVQRMPIDKENDPESIRNCPHCDAPTKETNKTFKLHLFINRTFECGTSINRSSVVTRSMKCLNKEVKNAEKNN